MADEANEWATLDGLLGVEAATLDGERVGELAFYGRCSTEDNQDPETSLGWQLGNARKFVEPLGGRVVTEFFDVGQSRSVPCDRREEGSRLLAELKNPHRGWSAVVVGEGTRCWFGTSSRSSRRGSPRSASSCGCPSWAAGSTRAIPRTRC